MQTTIMRPGFFVKALTLLLFISLIGVFIAYRMGVFSDNTKVDDRSFDTVMKDSIYDPQPLAEDMMPSTKSSIVVTEEWKEEEETGPEVRKVVIDEDYMMASSKTMSVAAYSNLDWMIPDIFRMESTKPAGPLVQPQKK